MNRTAIKICGALALGGALVWAGSIVGRERGPGPAGADPGPRLMIIDDDVGMFKQGVRRHGPFQAPWFPLTDPDGGLELIYALRDPRIKVLGITCTMGCSSTEVCLEAVAKILELTDNQDVPVLPGAASPGELGQPTEATHFIVNTVMSYPGQVEIVATAPLTNIATAMMMEPCLPRNWKALHLGTGEFIGALGEYSELGNYIRWFGYEDLNINADPEAVKYLLEHGGEFIIYPNEIMDDACLSAAGRHELKDTGTPLAEWVADEMWPYAPLMSGLQRLLGMEAGMPLHGVIPLAVAIDPELAEPPRELRVALEHQRRGGYRFVISDDPSVPARPVYVRLRDPQGLEREMIERGK